jgi:hypothetical protein
MKRKGLVVSIAAAAVLLSLVHSGTGDAVKANPASTTEVTIDGRKYRADDTGPGDASSLLRELARLGVQPPDPASMPEPQRDAHPVFSGKLAGSGQTPSTDVPEVPKGLTPDHTLRLSGDGGVVELAFGRTEAGGKTSFSRLAADVWVPLSVDRNVRGPRMLQRARGKETAVVCLDEKEGAFLLFRKVGR